MTVKSFDTRWLAPVVLGGLLLNGTQSISAQDSATATLPAAPLPSECVIAPVSEETFRSRLSEAPATPLATPVAPRSALSLFPSSGGASVEIREEIERLERQLAACYNAGDWRRAAALYTQSYLQRILAATGDRVMEFYPPQPEPLDPLDWLTLIVEDVRRVDDGRLAALVNYCGYKQVHYYRLESGAWRLEDSVDVVVEDGAICTVLPTTVTPTP